MAERRVDVAPMRFGEETLETNKVLKNTYMLLGLTLAFSAVTAGVSMALNLSPMAGLGFTLVGFVLLFVVNRMADSAKGLPAIFAFAGAMGAGLGPMLNHYMSMPGGTSLVMQSLGGTALIFFGLSAYALQSKRDFSFMHGFLFAGLMVAIVAMVANIFLQIPLLSVTLSAVVVMIMSGLILFDTSRIIHGGETNYIRATVGLYLNIYNIFVHLLSLLGVFGGDD
jgi:modulator of FtsH protease